MRRAWVWLLLAALCAPSLAAAQDESEDEAAEEAEADSEPADEAKPEALKAAPSTPPTWWFGAYVQGAWVPSFMLKLFLADAPTVSSFGFGFTATHRSADGMSLVLGLGYAGYGFEGSFRVKGDPDTDTEYLESSLGLLHLRGQVLWSTDIIKDTLSFEYGVGIDIGLVLGELKRTEAYRDLAGNAHPCVGPGNPPGGYCEPTLSGGLTDPYNQDGAHYHVVEKSVPPLMAIPMLPVLALRYTPIRSLAIKLDAAFGLLQFSLGLSAAYGVDL